MCKVGWVTSLTGLLQTNWLLKRLQEAKVNLIQELRTLAVTWRWQMDAVTFYGFWGWENQPNSRGLHTHS